MNFQKLFASITLAIGSMLIAIASFSQNTRDSAFRDDLLDHMVGKWFVSATVHGQKFTLDREAEWVMNHQYMRIYEKSREVIPWLNIPFERTIYIGYNHRRKRYLVYELTVHGGGGPFEPEGLMYGERTGNELKMSLKSVTGVLVSQRLLYDPASGSWNFQGRQVIDGKEQEPHVDQNAVRVKTESQ